MKMHICHLVFIMLIFSNTAEGQINCIAPDSIVEKYKDDATPLYTEFLKMGSVFSTVWIDDGLLYFSSSDGYIYAIG